MSFKYELKLEYQKERWLELKPWIKSCCTGKETVLDIGCGIGYITSKVAPYVKYIKGIDRKKIDIKYAKTHYASFVEQHDIIKENLPNCVWDIILYLGIYHKIIDKIERDLILKRIFEYAQYYVIIRTKIEFTSNIIDIASQYNFTVTQQSSKNNYGPLLICHKRNIAP